SKPSAQACKKRTNAVQASRFAIIKSLRTLRLRYPDSYRFAHAGAGIMGLASAASAGKTTWYFPPWTWVIRTGCWFCPLSNLMGPNGVEVRLRDLTASRILAGSAALALLMAAAATFNAA